MTKKKSRPMLLLVTGLLWTGLVQVQESANASGGVATGSGGTVADSVGQVAYTTNTGSSGSVAQGVQQAFEIFTVGINETELNISLLVFPNPTADNLILQVSNFELSTLRYAREIINQRTSNGTANANIYSEFASSYLLH